MHLEVLEEVDQFTVQPGDLLGLQWLEGQAIPFKQMPCVEGEMPLKIAKSRAIRTAGDTKYFIGKQCRRFPVKLYIQEVSMRE